MRHRARLHPRLSRPSPSARRRWPSARPRRASLRRLHPRLHPRHRRHRRPCRLALVMVAGLAVIALFAVPGALPTVQPALAQAAGFDELIAEVARHSTARDEAQTLVTELEGQVTANRDAQQRADGQALERLKREGEDLINRLDEARSTRDTAASALADTRAKLRPAARAESDTRVKALARAIADDQNVAAAREQARSAVTTWRDAFGSAPALWEAPDGPLAVPRNEAARRALQAQRRSVREGLTALEAELEQVIEEERVARALSRELPLGDGLGRTLSQLATDAAARQIAARSAIERARTRRDALDRVLGDN